MKSRPKPAEFKTLEKELQHSFKDRALLLRGLTHSSHANEEADASDDSNPQHNEQMEFLGDAVLSFVTSRYLFERFPESTEGSLSKMRAHLVSARHLLKVAKLLKVGEYLRLGRGEERSGGRSKSALLVDSLEALVGAIYLDGGIEPARKFILNHIVKPELDYIEKDPERALSMSDQKSALQEFLQATGRARPAYHVVGEEGPDHNKTFTVEVQIEDENGSASKYVGRAKGPTKKRAEQLAAQQALAALKSGTQDSRE